MVIHASTPMNTPLDQKDLLWRNQFLSEATQRSSSMLQQARAATMTSNGYLVTHGFHFLIMEELFVRHHRASCKVLFSSSDPNQASMVRLMMLRNQAQDTLKMQNDSARRQTNYCQKSPNPSTSTSVGQ